MLQSYTPEIQNLRKKERRGARTNPDKDGFQTMNKRGELTAAAAKLGGKGFEEMGAVKILFTKIVKVTVEVHWEVGRPQEGLHCRSTSCNTPLSQTSRHLQG